MSKKSTHWGKFVSEKRNLIKKNREKNVKIIGCPIFTKLPSSFFLKTFFLGQSLSFRILY